MRTLMIVMTMTLLSASAVGQIRVDAGTGLGYTIATTSFSQLPGFASCCPQYQGGTGTGLMVGVGVDVPVSSSLFGSVRLNTGNRSHTLSTKERVDIIVQNILTQATIVHTIAVPLQEYGVETQLGWRRGNVVLRAGVGYTLRSFGTVQSQEELTSPDIAVFSDTKSSIRNRISGALPAAISSSWNVSGSIGLDIPLGRGSRWRLTPEASLQAALSSMTSVTSWTVLVPSFGLRLSYEFPDVKPTSAPAAVPSPPVQPPPVIAVRTPEPVVQKTVAPPSKTIVKQRIVIEEVEEERFMPILPYIFFDRNSSAMPTRYQRSPGYVRSDTARSNVAFHHRVLDVIAERMKSDPSTRITITGHVSADEQDARLALQRATTVASLLIDSFGVASNRMSVQSRRLPVNLSRATGDESVLADEENRRVEITSSSPSLLLPYRASDTIMTVKNLDAGRNLSASDSVIIVADTVRLMEKRRMMVQDSVVERFDLIVFPFAKTGLSDDHRRVVDIVKSRIGSNARVTVEGSTDPLGPSDENAKLSLQRAQNVARELQGNITVIGRGEAPYDPSRLLPEERMFQRVVSIYALVPRGK